MTSEQTIGFESSSEKQLERNIGDILGNLDKLAPPDSQVAAHPTSRFYRSPDKTNNAFCGDSREIAAKQMLKENDGSWLDMTGVRTETKDGLFDPDAPDASYRLTFVRNHPPDTEPRPSSAFSIEMNRVKGYEPSVITWNLQEEGSGRYIPGQEISESKELKTLKDVSDQLDRENAALQTFLEA